MFKLTFFTSFFVFAVLMACSLATTSPPACMLACINEEPTPSDYEAVCGSQDVQSCLASKCASSEQAAINFFKSTCTTAGHQVATPVNSSGFTSKSVSTTASATGTSSGGNASITSSGPTTTGTGAQGQSGSGAANNVAFCGPLFLVLFVMGTMAL